MIGAPTDEAPTVSSTYERVVAEVQTPRSWATRAHRLVASVLGLLILAVTFVSFRIGKNRLISLALLGLTVFLAWLGMYSEGLHSPAIIMGNFGAAFAMLALLGWLVFHDARPSANASRSARRWVALALVFLSIQIALGGLTSANFAAAACTSVPDCNTSWLPGSDLWTDFDLSRQHEIGPSGVVLGGAERVDILKAHRLMAVVTLLVTFVAGVLAFRARLTGAALAVLILVLLEFSVGMAAILTNLPMLIAVAHNLLAALLLLGLLRLLALCRNRQALL